MLITTKKNTCNHRVAMAIDCIKQMRKKEERERRKILINIEMIRPV
jgi:hypothetical protein